MTRIDSSSVRSSTANTEAVPGAPELQLSAKALPSAPVIPDIRLPSRRPEVKIAYADAFATAKAPSVTTQRALSGGTWLCDFVRENAGTLGRAESAGAVGEAFLKSAGSDRTAPRDLTLFAHRFSPEAMRNQVTRLVREHVRSENSEAVIEGLLQGVSNVVVNTTARAPVSEALVDTLTQRNESLEAIANGASPESVRNGERGPGATPWTASSAREQLKASDRVMHELSASLYARTPSTSDIYALVPDITRVSLATDVIGLPASAYPFSNTPAETFAQKAVLDALATSTPVDATTRSLVESAAQGARRTARELFNPMRRTQLPKAHRPAA